MSGLHKEDSWNKVIVIITSILIPFLIGFFWVVVYGTRFVDTVYSMQKEQKKQTTMLKAHTKKFDTLSIRVTMIEQIQKANQKHKKK